MLHQELGRERMTQIHREVEHNRLDARLAKAARSEEDGAARRGRVARGRRASDGVVQVGGLLWALARDEGGEAEGPSPR
jgi:hypothetical protein